MSPIPVKPRFADEVRSSARLAGPLAAGHLSHGLVGVVDTVVAGHHGTETLAAVAVGAALFWLPMMLPMGTLMALPPAVSELDGGGRRTEIGPLWRQSLWLALALGLLLFALMSVLPVVLTPMSIVPGATAFIHAIRWGIPAFTLYLCMRYLSDGLHWSLPTMLIGFGGLFLLAPLGYVMTNGLLGFPEMGAAGLGWASAAMFWLQLLAFAFYLARSQRFADLQLFTHLPRPDWRVLRGLLVTGLPIGITISMEGSLFIVTALLIGRLGELPVAAHQIAINIASLCFMIPFGIAEATTVRVGHALGRGDRAGVRRAAFAGMALVLGTQAVSATVMLTANHAIAGLYTADAAVAGLAASLLLYAALFQFPDGVQVLSAGALRGLKDTRMPMLLALFAYWCIGMPVGAVLGLGWGGLVPAMGPRGMWIGLTAGLSVAAVLLGRRFLRSSLRTPTSGEMPAAPSVIVTDGA